MKALNIKSESDFFKYVYFGQIDEVKELLKDNPELLECQTCTGGQMTPLLVAAYKGCFNVLSFLIKQGANLSARAQRPMEVSGRGMSIFDLVSENGDTNCLRVIKHISKDGVCFNQNELLMSMRFAVRNSHFDYLAFYLESFDSSHMFWSTDPFGELAMNGNFNGIVKLTDMAKKQNLSPFLFDPVKLSCLVEMAFNYGHLSTAIDIVDYFKLKPSSINIGLSQDSLLHGALKNNQNQMDSFLTLYKHFPDLSLAKVNLQGATLLHFGAKHLDSFKDLERLIQLCREYVSPYAQDINGMTIMHYAAMNGKLDTVLELGKKYPRLKFSHEDNNGLDTYNHILNLLKLKTNVSDQPIFQNYFLKMLKIQGLCLKRLKALAHLFVSYSSQEYQKVQKGFQIVYNFFNYMFLDGVSSYDKLRKHIDAFSSCFDSIQIDLNVVFGLPIKNEKGKSLLDVLVEKGNCDALTFYLKSFSKVGENCKINLSDTDFVEEDEEPLSEPLCEVYTHMLKTIHLNSLEDRQLSGLHLAFARCGVLQSKTVVFSNEIAIDEMALSGSSKKHPFSKDDQRLLLEGLINKDLCVVGTEPDFSYIKPVALYSQINNELQKNLDNDVSRDMIVILAKKLKDKKILCKYLDVSLNEQKSDLPIEENFNISTTELLMFSLINKINAQKENLKDLNTQLDGFNSTKKNPNNNFILNGTKK